MFEKIYNLIHKLQIKRHVLKSTLLLYSLLLRPATLPPASPAPATLLDSIRNSTDFTPLNYSGVLAVDETMVCESTHLAEPETMPQQTLLELAIERMKILSEGVVITIPAGSYAVIKLIENLEHHTNFKIYYDNWFSCPFLAQFLLDYGFHSVSTVQKRKVKGLEFPSSDKTFLKSPRGSFESMVNEKKSLTVVRWNDNKPVCLLASFVGAGEPEFCLRFDKKKMVRI